MSINNPAGYMEETQSKRSRSVFWLFALLAATALALVGANRLGLLGRGINYYYPRWTWGDTASDEALATRRRDLDDTAVGLPILLRLFEAKPSKVGVAWESTRQKLPPGFASYLPQYQDAGKFGPAEWLARHSTNSEVFAAVQKRWPTWDDELKSQYVGLLFTAKGSMFPALSEILTESLGSSNEELAMAAAVVASRTDPLPDDVDRAVVRFIENSSQNGPAGTIHQWRVFAKNMAGHRSLSQPERDAFEKVLSTGPRSMAALAAFVLASREPDRFPPDTIFKRTFSRLNGKDRDDFVAFMSFPNRIGEDLSNTDFFQTLLVDLLPRGGMTNSAMVLRSRNILGTLARNGRNSKAHAEALERWLDPANPLSGEALSAYLQIAPRTPGAAAALMPLLDRRAYCAEVMLWMAEAGTNVVSLENRVAELAADTHPIQYETNAAGQRVTITGPMAAR